MADSFAESGSSYLTFAATIVNMKLIIKTLLTIVTTVTILNCRAQQTTGFQAKKVYGSAHLIITQIAENSFVHNSLLQTDDFGNVPCNGLLVRNGNESIVFDTPTNDTASAELIKWAAETLHCKINAVIATHFHKDCLGGLKAFDAVNIPSYAYYKTIEFAKATNVAVPKNGFADSIILKLGDEYITAKFFGEGHTRDNVIGYFAADNIMFGGCLIKETGAGKGFLGDANVKAWSGTVEKIKKTYPRVKIVVPGHGDYGDNKLLDYTIQLFKTK